MRDILQNNFFFSKQSIFFQLQEAFMEHDLHRLDMDPQYLMTKAEKNVFWTTVLDKT